MASNTGDTSARGDRRKYLGYDYGPGGHNPDWQGYKDYGPIFDMIENNPPQGVNPQGTNDHRYQLDQNSLGDNPDDDPHDLNDDFLDPNDESDFAGRELASADPKTIAGIVNSRLQGRGPDSVQPHNPDWPGYKMYPEMFDAVEAGDADAYNVKYEDRGETPIDPDREPDFAGRQLAGVADAMYRRRKENPDAEHIRDLQEADRTTQDAGRRLIPEQWDKFLASQAPSQNFEDRRGDPPLSDEEIARLVEDTNRRESAGTNYIPEPRGANDAMGKALGNDDLDRLIQQYLMVPPSNERIQT